MDAPYPARRGFGRRFRESPVSAWWISVAIHLAAFGVLTRIVWQDRPAPRRQIIAEAWLGPEAGGGVPSRAGPQARTPERGETSPIEARSAGKPDIAGVSPDDELGRLVGTIASDATDTVPLTSSATEAAAGMELGLGPVGAGGSGMGGGGSFGGVTSGGPSSGFFGQRGNAYKVVYVIDTSASLITILEGAQRELIESIDRLAPTQSFHVIFAGEKLEELPERRLVPAIAAYKEPAKKFVRDLVVSGRCDPVAAMERAFAVEPELIYFLTDGAHLPYAPKLLQRLEELNRDRRVHITTIGFGERVKSTQGRKTPVGEPLLRQIAQEHGGNFRWVDEEEDKGP